MKRNAAKDDNEESFDLNEIEKELDAFMSQRQERRETAANNPASYLSPIKQSPSIGHASRLE